MRKIISIWIVLLLMMSGIVLIVPSENEGAARTPFNRWGYAYDTAGLLLDTEWVTAWIDGVEYGRTVTLTGIDVGLFTIDTIGDDTTPDNIKTGGYPGDVDTIYYVHGDLTGNDVLFVETDIYVPGGFNLVAADLWESNTNPALLKINNVSSQSSFGMDYVVIYNPTPNPVNASGYSMSVAEGVSINITESNIVSDMTAWDNIIIPGFGYLAIDMTAWGGLSSLGNSIQLLDAPSGFCIDRVEYGTILTEPENTILANAPPPGAGNQLRRTSEGLDTNNCTSDFIISGEYLPLAPPSVLLVDADSWGDGLANYYIWPLQNNSANYTLWDVYGFWGPPQGKPTAADMMPYDIVIWVPQIEMGYDGDPLDGTDETEISAYLDGGGNYMLSNIVYTDWTDFGSTDYDPGDFAYDYLGLDYVNSWSLNEFSVNATIGDEVFGGIGPCIQDWMRGPWGLYWGFPPFMSDDLTAGLGTICFFNDDGFGTQAPAGIRYDSGTFKTIFFGFPYETLDSANADEIMNRTLNWFSQHRSYPDIEVNKTVDHPIAQPNDIITYTVAFDNTGASHADFVWINDTLPAGVTYIGDTAAAVVGAAYLGMGISGQNLYFNFSNTLVGPHSFTISVMINPSVPNGTWLSNYVTCNYTPSGQLSLDWADTLVLIFQPDMWIDPAFFDFALAPDQSDLDILTVGNSGMDVLNYNITYPVSAESYALYFDGINDYVDCGNPPSLNGFNDFTLEAWVNTTYSIDTPDIISKYTATDNYRLRIEPGTGQISFVVRDGTGTSSTVTSIGSVTDGYWHHVVGVRSSGTLYVYIDGSYDNQAIDNEPGSISPSTNFIIGRRSDMQNEFRDKIDEVRVLNRALNPAEILGDYQAGGHYPDRAGIVGWWQFDENIGTIAYDSSGFGNDGDIWGALWTDGIPEAGSSWLSVSPLSGSLPVSWTENHTVTVNSTGLAPGFYQTNISIESNDPDETLIIVPVNLTVLPPEHDIAIQDMTIEGGFEAEKPLWINGTILNQGSKNETNVEVRLLVDFGLENSTTIASLNSSEQKSVSFLWAPPLGVQYTLSLFAVPVIGENITVNNWWNETINVTAQPDIWVSPDSYDITLTAGEVGVYNMTLGNDGLANLNYSILYGDCGNSYALSFDGADDYVETPYIADTFNNHDFSIEAWIYPTSNSSDAIIYAIGESNDDDKALEFKISNGYVEVWHWYDNWDTEITIDLFNWTHLVYVYKSLNKTGMLYKNGVYEGTNTFTGFLNVQNDTYIPSQIGHGYGSRFFNGTIDEVRILNTQLSSAEVLEDYLSGGFYPNRPGTVAWWHFDEFTGNIVYDSSGNNYNGNINGATWIGGIQGTYTGADWLSVSPDTGFLLPFGEDYLNITVDTSNLAEGFYQANITVSSNDPDEPTIIIPVNLTVLPPDHDIDVSDITGPSQMYLGDTTPINATVTNQGLFNEPIIEVQLQEDGILIDNMFIGLNSGNSQMISFDYSPVSPGLFNISIYAVPVIGENITYNNEDWTFIEVIAIPDIWVTPRSYDIAVTAGEVYFDNMTIGNDGIAGLYYNITDDDGTGGSWTNPVNNPSFETGDFTGWVNQDISTPYWPLHVSPAGETGEFTTAPTDGNYAVAHGFDGDGPGTIVVAQDLVIPLGATTLEFDYRPAWINWGAWNRIFYVDIEPAGGGMALQNDTIFEAINDNVWHDEGDLHGIVDISLFGGIPVRISFEWFIPESFTGWAQFQLDNIIINSTTGGISVWLSEFPTTGTISPSSNTNILITANASFLEPGFYQANITISSNDPDEPDIIIPVNLTVLPPDHDIKVLDIQAPSLMYLGDMAQINATVINLGLFNEANIEIQLREDGVPISNQFISLNSGDSQMVNFDYWPSAEGIFNISIYAVPVPNEYILFNNEDWAFVDVIALPDIWVSPSGFDFTVNVGETETDNLTIGNDGYANLNYTILTDSGHFFDDVESGQNGWTTVDYSGSGDLWHITTSFFNSSSHSWWCGDEGTGNYNFGLIQNALISPEIDLMSSPAELSFWEWYDTEVGWDDCRVEITTTGGASWTVLRSSTWGNNGGWNEYNIDLSPYVGNSIQIRFYFDTQDGGVNNYPGWRIDDIKITGTSSGTGVSWLNLNPTSGIVSPGGSDDIMLTVNTSNLTIGFYQTNITILSNDPDEPIIIIPVFLTVIFEDLEPPQYMNEHPSDGVVIGDVRPIIWVHVTDNVEVNVSTIRLYVRGFPIFYDISPIPGGYNVSYTHIADYPEGDVPVRIIARDTSDNLLDFTWVFHIDLSPPVAWDIYPPPDGMTQDTTPKIRLNVTDASGIVTLSTMRLYVQDFPVFYEYSSIPDGFNLWYNHDFGFAPGELVRCRIRAEDSLGNWLDYFWNFTISDYIFAQIPVQIGWNLISFPVIPDDTSLPIVLQDLDGDTTWDEIQWYDPLDIMDHWKTYATFKPPHLNDLTNVTRSMSVWLYVADETALGDAIINVTGLEPVTTTIPLYTGWNMVGYPTLTSKQIYEALNGTGYTAVEGFDPNSPYNTIPLNDTYMMKPGEGYWVEVAADTYWTIDW